MKGEQDHYRDDAAYLSVMKN